MSKLNVQLLAQRWTKAHVIGSSRGGEPFRSHILTNVVRPYALKLTTNKVSDITVAPELLGRAVAGTPRAC